MMPVSYFFFDLWAGGPKPAGRKGRTETGLFLDVEHPFTS